METTGKEFVDFWAYAIKKGLMNPNTARSLGGPVKQILSIDEDWESKDVSTVDTDELLTRFHNMRGKDFKPESLQIYDRRFKQALDLFLQYTSNPTGFRYQGGQANNRKNKSGTRRDKSESKNSSSGEATGMLIGSSTSMIDYPFPLRENCIARFKLPIDLRNSDIERIIAFLRTISVDQP